MASLKHDRTFRRRKTVPANVSILESGFLLRNGDYSAYAVVSRKLDEAFAELNRFPGCQIPRSPGSLGSRMGFHRIVMETIIRIYAASSLPKIIAAPVKSLGIAPDRYVQGSDTL
jgi:hypothetical protein